MEKAEANVIDVARVERMERSRMMLDNEGMCNCRGYGICEDTTNQGNEKKKRYSISDEKTKANIPRKPPSSVSTPNDARLAEKGEGNARVPDVKTKHVRAAPAVVQCGYVFYSFQSFVFHLGHRSVGWLVSWGSWVT